MHLFAPLVLFLGFQRHRGDRARIQPLQADRLSGHLAIAVFATLDPPQRRVDLGDQLALAVAGAQFQRAVGLFAGAVGQIGDVAGAVLQVVDGLGRLPQQFLLPDISLRRKYSSWRSFMNGSSSAGR
jgi:hypothetical protein